MYSQTLLVAPTLRVSSPLSPLSVPSICISPAADASSYQDAPVALEPTSPEDALSPRSTHLLPPPVRSPLRRTLVPSIKAADKKGLDQSTFDDLLIANRERAAKRSANSADRLRREVVVKAHHCKQIERRALFLSRITAPPSPTSAETAVTPPETPAVFHFTLPSPGLASPLELFENVKARDSWVEHVDYNNTKRAPSRLPSLDQITARLRLTVPATSAIPTVVVQAPVLTVVAPLNVVKGERQDEVKPRASRLPDSIRASTRARATPTPVPTTTTAAAPSQLIIPSSPPKSIKPVLVPQSIPALRINHTPSTGPELAPIPVMSWRDRATATPIVPRKEPTLLSMGSWKEQPQQVQQPRKEPLIQAGSWRDAQGQLTSWREVPIKKELVRNLGIPPISPRTVMPQPIGAPAPVLATSRRSALWRAEKSAAGAVQLTESERRAVQGRNMVDKLRRRISAPAEMEGSMRRGVPVGGF